MDIRRVAVLGAGRLGRGIAESAASKGYDVVLFSQGAGGKDAVARIEKSLDRKLAKWGITESEKRLILGRISYTQDLRELGKADLLVEATLDQMQIKKELLHTADQLCRPDVVFISASATMRISDLSREIKRSDMLVGLHFIPPVTQVAVAELVRGDRTGDHAVETAKTFAKRLGKQAVEIEESRGLVNPRALIVMINEAAYLIDEGVCEARDAEMILKESWGMKQGPLEMADRLGLDLVLSWMEQLQMTFGPRYAPCPLLRRYVREGRLGVKTRLGFLAYTEDDAVSNDDEGDKED
ncbi:MAG: 3-hydroxyacyl-CoA dehydrogenase family protein [Limnochordia bacterium]|nr:3-hydroxyacyl-CoA dehydrogenase family protein [Limnochordia bacterium]